MTVAPLRTTGGKGNDAFRAGERYCILGVYWADKPRVYQPFALRTELEQVKPRVVVFDTIEMARAYAEFIGNGRLPLWDEMRESCFFSPLDPAGYNRIDVITGYDPYNVPAGYCGGMVGSEARSLDWKHHVGMLEATEAIKRFAKRTEGARVDRENRKREARWLKALAS